MTSAPARPRTAFALPELAATILILSLLTALLSVLHARAARTSTLTLDLQKLGQISAGTSAYAADNAGQLWSFSWQGGQWYNTPWPELNFAETDFAAQVNQSVYLLRTLANEPNTPVHSGWIPHPRFSHLVLADYLAHPVPSQMFISAADTDLLRWADDPDCFNQDCFSPCQPSPNSKGRKYIFSSSFQIVPAAWDRSPVGSRITQSSPDAYMIPRAAELGNGRLSDVAHPSRKVLVHDTMTRHFGRRQPTFNHPQARIPLLFADGGVHVRATAEANPGWRPNDPSNPSPTIFDSWVQIGRCVPGGYQLPAETDNVFAPGVYRWTRAGLAGIDFDAPETNTGQNADGSDQRSTTPAKPTGLIAAP